MTGGHSSVDILNAVAPGFFGMTQGLIYNDVILAISRLTDPAANRNQENTSLKRLLQATNWEATDRAKWDVFSAKIVDVDRACDACRQHRNKRISHADLALSLHLSLPDTTLKVIDTAVESIESFIRDINFELRPDVEQSFETLNGDWDVKRLMRHLENRPSQKEPEATSIIIPNGEHSAQFRCAFCGETRSIAFYPNGVPTPRREVRRHFDSCQGVTGHETIAVAIKHAGDEPAARFTVDLTLPTRDADA